MYPSGPGYGPCRSFAQPVSVFPSNQISSLSATPSSLVSVNFQMCGGAATYSEPFSHIAPSGNITFGTNTVDLSYTPSPRVLSRRTMRCGFVFTCSATFAFEPDESQT